MKQNSIYLLILFFVFSTGKIFSQNSKITLEQTIVIALKNNYDILIAKNNTLQATNNNSLGNAGMLPRIDLNASTNLANNNVQQEFSNGTIINKNGVGSQNIAAGAYLTWTVFDGLKMFATQKKLAEFEEMGKLNAKIQIENTLTSVIKSFYSIAKQKQIIKGFEESFDVSEERLKIAQKKSDIGSSSEFEVLQAKVDLNILKSNLIRQKTLLKNAKAELNQLLLQPVEFEFDIDDSLELIHEYKYDELQKLLLSNNSDLIFAEKNVKIYKYLMLENRSSILPKVNLNTNYLFNRAQNQAGFSLLNKNSGINFGFTATSTIFNGFNYRTTSKNLELAKQNSIYELENIKTKVQLNLYKSFKNYEDDISILKLEEENYLYAKQTLKIALEQFKLGISTSIELKLIQQSYEDVVNRLATAKFNAKISEAELLKISGKIIK